MQSSFWTTIRKLVFAAAVFSPPVTGLATGTQSLAIVDLGYTVHQATLNSSGQYPYLNFSNIRYAQAPVGDLRFSAPVPPTGRNKSVNDGQQGSICPQASPDWTVTAGDFLEAYLLGLNISNYTNPTTHAMAQLSTSLSIDPSTTEDCLFLDVIVPQNIFNGTRRLGKAKHNGAPVLVWIYGGGYTSGSKISSGNPASLIARSQEDGKEGVVYVAMNYRLGLFGWLAGNPDVTANAGLLDQRLALEWVQKNIHKFGGDPNRVTVMGESAGAGSIFHHITAYGGKKGPVPFQQAIAQSPAFFPVVPCLAERDYKAVLGNASLLSNTTITTAKQLRALPFEELYAVNAIVTGASTYGQFTWGPVLDPTNGSYVPDFPLRLLDTGGFDHNVSVMIGHNSDEGLLFTNPAVQTEPEFAALVHESFPSANESIISYVTTVMYPPIYNGSYGYTSAIERTALATAQLVATCNAYDLAATFSKKGSGSSYAYLFSVPPGLHGEDVGYTFYNGDTTGSEGLPIIPNIAVGLQQYLTNFALSGNPANGTGLPSFSQYGNGTVTDIASSIAAFGSHIEDPAIDARCAFWRQAPYYSGS